MSSKSDYSFAILSPVFNDWSAFSKLVENIDSLNRESNINFTIFAIDDGSFTHFNNAESLELTNIVTIRLVTLLTNLGHQRAIAVGLCEIERSEINFDAVIVMDSDGEDSPSDVFKLIDSFKSNKNSIIVAQRVIRSENLFFRVMYLLYKLIFKSLTGKRIDFGNFSLIPSIFLNRIINMPDLWNHFAATILRSGLAIYRVPTARGKRYSGVSTMSFISLATHGLGAISVFIDFFLVRILLFLASVCTLSLSSIFIILSVKFFTNMAVPGWASYTTALAFIVFLQSSMFALISIFMILSSRSLQLNSLPTFSNTYVRNRSVLFTLNDS